MLVSQGKVLSPGNDGSMAVIVQVSISAQLCFICVHMPISGLSSLVQFLYMPVKVLPWVVVGAGGLGAGKTSGAGTRGVFLDVVIGGRTRDPDTNGGESSDNRSKVHADCGPAENPSL